MVEVLSAEVLHDELAVSLARALAKANLRARDSGVDVLQSLITVSQRMINNSWRWRINYGPKDYVIQRGGDLIIEVDPVDATIKEVLKGQ